MDSTSQSGADELVPDARDANGREPRAAVYRRLAAMVEAADDPIIGMTVEGVITSWNSAAERLYGFSAEEAIDRSILMLVPDDRAARGGRLLERVLRGDTVAQHETVRMCKDRRLVHVSISMSPIKDADGVVVGAAAFTRDVTEKKRAEAKLRRSEAQLAEAQQVAELGSWEWDAATGEISWSRQLFGIVGLDPSESRPNGGFLALVHPDDRPRAELATQRAFADHEPFTYEARLLGGDGVERVIEARGRVDCDEAGQVVRCSGTVQDITERRRAQAELERLSRRTEAILNSAGEGIAGMAVDGRLTFFNAAAMRLTGFEPDEAIGHPGHALFHHSRPDGSPYPRQECPISEAIRLGVDRSGADQVFWRKDGTSFPVEYTVAPVREEGELTAGMIVFKDITERRVVDRMKDEFISVVSHELRTPLTSIRGSLGLLAGGALGPLPPKGQRMVDIAVSNTERLVRLINDILDIERMESRRATMHKEAADVAALVGDAAEMMRPIAAAAGVELAVQPLDDSVWADSDRIVQTLTNLLSNAIKFSPRNARVSVTCEREVGEILFRISDEGRGIPPDQLETVFERFQQVDASDSREKGGTGLGLAICRSIVHAHEGRIWAESAGGQGTTLCFTLPMADRLRARPQTSGSAVRFP